MKFNETEETKLVERKTKSDEIYYGNLLHVYKDTIELPNGNEATREHMRHIGAVGIVPLTKDGEVIIERQFRYPLDKVITEIPAGKLNDSSEDRLAAAKRELQEETGFIAGKWTNLGDYHPAAAYTNERLTLYLAEDLELTNQNLDEDEFLHVHKIPLTEVIEAIMNGEITDGKTLAAILKVARIKGV